MHINSIKTYIAIGLIFCFPCTGRRNYLEEALQLAGDNHPELEKVLDHYEQNTGNPLKYRAAVFLIENMPGHYSYKHQDFLQYYYDEVANAVNPDNDNEVNKRIIVGISEKYNDNRIRETVWDIQTVTAEYLVNNIECSFGEWENGEWATHIPFKDFCNYILPYKGSELQALDDWCEYVKGMLKWDINLLHYCDLYKNVALQAATSVSQEIIHLSLQENPAGVVNSIPVKDMRAMAKMPFGLCMDYVFIALPVMRNKGIPVMEDFTPQWLFQALGHSWCVFLGNNGKNMVFSRGSTNLGELHKPDEKMAKIFRRCHAINREIIGTKWAFMNQTHLAREAAFDDNPLTFFDAPEPSGGWVGMDFGHAVRIRHISYTPRGDRNDITPSDLHECLYWYGNQWVSHCRRVANDIVLTYENVPANTIYLKRNHSRGKDERFFTYENGKQVWR